MRIAVCTSSGSDVDLHFGKTTTFYIYEVEKGRKTLLAKRKVEAYSPSAEFLKESEGSHAFDPSKFELAFAVISDCRKLYTLDIGDEPASKLKEKGIEVQLCDCPIEKIPTCSGKCKPR